MTTEDSGLTPTVEPVGDPAAPMKGQLARRNLSTALLQRGASLVSAFVRIPLLLHTLGPARYGIWLGVFAAAGFSTITDFGLQMAVTQQVAQHRGRGHPEEIRPLVATAFWLSVACFAVVSLVTVAWVTIAPPFREQASAAGVESADVRLLLLVACLGSFAVQPPKILVAAQYGFEKMYALNVCDVAAVVVNIAGLWLLTGIVGGSLLILGAWAVLWDLTVAMAVAAVLVRRHPANLSISWREFRPVLIRPLVRQAAAFFFGTVANGLRWSLDGLVILTVLGPAVVPRYEPSMRLFLTGLAIVPLVFGTLWPSFAESAARLDWDWVNRAFGVATVSVLGVAVVVFTLTQLFGRDFLLRWVGSAGFSSQAILLALGTWFLVTAWVQIAAHLTISLGGAATVTKWGLVEGVVNVVLTVMLARAFGLAGVAIASLVSVAAFGALPITLSERHISLPARQIGRLAVVAGAAVLLAALIRTGVGAPMTIPVLLPVATVAGVLTAGAVWSGVFSSTERRLLVSQLRTGLRRRQRPS